MKKQNEKTLESYQKTYDRLMARVDKENGFTFLDALCDTNSKSTYFFRLAATYSVLTQQILEVEGLLSKAQSDNDPYMALVLEDELNNLSLFNDEIDSLSSNEQRLKREKRRSKRSSLSGLPTDWREQLYLKSASSKYEYATLATILSGCRPAELVNGIDIVLKTDPRPIITIQIRGAKIGVTQGQETRQLEYDLSQTSFLLQVLEKALKEHDNHIFAQIKNTKAFSLAITRMSKHLWPRHRHDITPYSLRHAFASDLKSKFSEVDIAKALGHASTRTQKTYGQRQLSNKRLSITPSRIWASSAVRQIEVSHPVFEASNIRP